MISTFHGIEVGKRGLQTHQQGMHVVEHNIANANTEGYSRQRISFEAMQPLYVPGLSREETPGQVGQGNIVQSITRVRNEFIDDRIMEETSTLGYWKTTHEHLYQIEQLHNESSAQTIRNDLDQFWKSWENSTPTLMTGPLGPLSGKPQSLSHEASRRVLTVSMVCRPISIPRSSSRLTKSMLPPDRLPT